MVSITELSCHFKGLEASKKKKKKPTQEQFIFLTIKAKLGWGLVMCIRLVVCDGK